MARLCAGLAMLAALAIVCAIIRFAFKPDASGAIATMLVSALTTLLGAGVGGLLLRKKPDGSSETIDDVKPTKEHAAAQTTVTVDTKAGQ
jgi:hypothetical protein